MTETLTPTQTPNRVVVSELQSTLVELIDLNLQAKQAHWCVVGPNFRSLHLELDEIADFARESSDAIAERLAAIGVAPDGRPGTVAEAGALEPFPAGWVRTEQVVDLMTGRLARIAVHGRERIERLDGVDLMSHDLLIELVQRVEKAAWMLRAQRS